MHERERMSLLSSFSGHFLPPPTTSITPPISGYGMMWEVRCLPDRSTRIGKERPAHSEVPWHRTLDLSKEIFKLDQRSHVIAPDKMAHRATIHLPQVPECSVIPHPSRGLCRQLASQIPQKPENHIFILVVTSLVSLPYAQSQWQAIATLTLVQSTSSGGAALPCVCRRRTECAHCVVLLIFPRPCYWLFIVRPTALWTRLKARHAQISFQLLWRSNISTHI